MWSVCIGNDLTVRTAFDFAVLSNLPQGSFWYLQLLFYWYIIFFFLTFLFDNEKALVIALCVATLGITIYHGFNRLYVWQFASFPAGIIVCKHQELMDRVSKKIRGGALLLVMALIMIALKKTQYVEVHELGAADTLLQIGITWCLSLFMFCLIEHLKKMIVVKRCVLLIGSISYELYLAHVLPLDWLKQQVTIKNFLIYGVVVLLSTVILYVADYLIQRVEKV